MPFGYGRINIEYLRQNSTILLTHPTAPSSIAKMLFMNDHFNNYSSVHYIVNDLPHPSTFELEDHEAHSPTNVPTLKLINPDYIGPPLPHPNSFPPPESFSYPGSNEEKAESGFAPLVIRRALETLRAFLVTGSLEDAAPINIIPLRLPFLGDGDKCVGQSASDGEKAERATGLHNMEMRQQDIFDPHGTSISTEMVRHSNSSSWVTTVGEESDIGKELDEMGTITMATGTIFGPPRELPVDLSYFPFADILDDYANLIPPAHPASVIPGRPLEITSPNEDTVTRVSFRLLRVIVGTDRPFSLLKVMAQEVKGHAPGLRPGSVWVMKICNLTSVKRRQVIQDSEYAIELRAYQRIAKARRDNEVGFEFLMQLEASIVSEGRRFMVFVCFHFFSLV